MKKFAVVFAMGCLALSVAKAEDYTSGTSFVVTHPTTISAIGAYDGGAGFKSTETVGIFSDLNGNLVGSEVVFGPGDSGTQVGSMFYENVPIFVLSPGDYSLITLGNGGFSSGGGSHLSGGNSFLNLGDDIDLPGGGRFNSGTSFDVVLFEGSGSLAGPVALVDPPNGVPDGGLTALLLGCSLAGLGLVRRKI
jgi:VPDSG-CTERM motif